MRTDLNSWARSGKPWIWLNAGMASAAIIMVVGLLLFIAAKGMAHFWPGRIAQFDYVEDNGEQTRVLGIQKDSETLSAARLREIGLPPPAGETEAVRVLFKTGNRDVTGSDFHWFVQHDIREMSEPTDAMVVEREEWGDFLGFPVALKEGDSVVAGTGITTGSPQPDPETNRRNRKRADRFGELPDGTAPVQGFESQARR